MFFVSGALARIRTRNDWFEASYDIQFHHEGINNHRTCIILPKKLKKSNF
jgi:hypothetical protein